jgi:hypothetical protein
MSVLQIRPAQREGARLVIGLAGWTGCGKTTTAILLAYGLANYDASKVGFIDTENRRGSLMADILQTTNPPTDVPFLIGDLVAPFSPQRYIDAISDFEKAGVEVLIIDSISHEHEGPGGLIDIADDNKYWNRAKFQHKKFVNALLQSSMHIIVCVRAREMVEMVKVKDESTNRMKVDYQDKGLQPVTEKNLMFDMTASLMMYDEGSRQTKLKCPGALQAILGRGQGYITPADGKAIRDWVDGAKQLDPTVEKFRSRLLSNCEQGVVHIQTCWDKTPPAIQEALGAAFLETLKSSAKAYDDAKAAAGADHPHDPAPPAGSSPSATVAANAIAAAAAAGRATRVETPPAQAPAADPAPVQQPAAQAPAAAPSSAPAPQPAAQAPAPQAAAPAPKPAPTPAAAPKPAATPPAAKVTNIRQTPPASLPMATPPAAKRTALAEPMF